MPKFLAHRARGRDQRRAESEALQSPLEVFDLAQPIGLPGVDGPGIRGPGRNGQGQECPDVGGGGCRDAVPCTEPDERLQSFEFHRRGLFNARQSRDAGHVRRTQDGTDAGAHLRPPFRILRSALSAARVIASCAWRALRSGSRKA